MASHIEMNTAMKLMKEGLEGRVSQQIEDEIVAKMLAEFETKAREIVRAETEKVTVESVQAFVDHMRLGEEIQVLMKWDGE